MIKSTHLPAYHERLADYMVLDTNELVRAFHADWEALINRFSYNLNTPFRGPDINKVIRKVYESIRNEPDAELELATMAFYDIAETIDAIGAEDTPMPRYRDEYMKLSNLTVSFGKQLIAKLKQDFIYTRGYIPYNYREMVGRDICVMLDETRLENHEHPKVFEYHAAVAKRY